MEPFTINQHCEGDPCASPPDSATRYCVSCDSFFCDICWDLQGPHRPGKVGLDGWPHEKADINIVRRLQAILMPLQSQETLETLHREDEENTWFGVTYDPATGGSFFQDYGRYTSLMEVSGPLNEQARYPQLVSFIGETSKC